MRPGLAWLFRVCLALALGIGSAAAVDDGVTGTWTVLIPDAFPTYVFTWRIAAGGGYDEDGREGATGTSQSPASQRVRRPMWESWHMSAAPWRWTRSENSLK